MRFKRNCSHCEKEYRPTGKQGKLCDNCRTFNRINTTAKMYRTNRKVKDWLVEGGYSDIHLFPHTRFIKDVTIEGLDFDGVCRKDNKIVFFQNKTNLKITKKMLADFRALAKKYGIRCMWFNAVDRGELGVYE